MSDLTTISDSIEGINFKIIVFIDIESFQIFYENNFNGNYRIIVLSNNKKK